MSVGVGGIIGDSGGGGGATPHNLLDGFINQDTVNFLAARGYVIVGDSSNKWNGLLASVANQVLIGDGTDVISRLLLPADIPTLPKSKIDTAGTWLDSEIPANIARRNENNDFTTFIQTMSRLRLVEQTTPANPPANTAELYSFDRVGRTVLRYITPSGLEVQLAQDNLLVARNNSGVTLTKGTPVYVTGAQGSNRPTIDKAQSNLESTADTLGVTAEDIPNNSDGFVMFSGQLEQIDTSAFLENDILWVSATVAGTFTATKPAIPPNYPKPVARVLNSHATQGRILVFQQNLRGNIDGTNKLPFTIGNNSGVPYFQFSIGELDLFGNNLRNAGFVESNASSPASVGAIRLGNNESIGWRNFLDNGNFTLTLVLGNVITSSAPMEFNSYIQSNAIPPAQGGAIRLGVNESVFWRNAANNANYGFTVTSANEIEATVNSPIKCGSLRSFFANVGGGFIRMGNGQSVSWRNNANTNDLTISTDASDRINLLYAGAAKYLFSATEADFQSQNIINLGFVASNTANRALSGFERLARLDEIKWRNQANSADLALGVDTSNRLTWVSNIIETQNNKSQASGYASLDGTTKVPTAELATGAASSTVFLRGDRVWATPTATAGNPPVRTETTNYTAGGSDEIIMMDATSGILTLTFPTAVGVTGKIYTIKKIDSSLANEVVLNTTSGQTIDGIASGVMRLTEKGEQITVYSDGSNWRVRSRSRYSMFAYRFKGATINRNHSTPSTLTALATATIVANTLYAMPFVVEDLVTIDQLLVNVTTGGAGSSVRFGIYSDDGNLYPDALIVDGGAISSATTGVKTASVNVSLGKGLYWLVVECNATAPVIRGFALASLINVLGLDSGLGTAQGFGWSVSFTFAALPATFPAGGAVRTTIPAPYIGVRFSS